MRRLILVVTLLAASAPAVAGQTPAAEAEYMAAVARFFNLPPNEVAILGEWDLPPDHLPVVLFMARRSGVSAEALVALRDSGQSWSRLAARYRVGPSALHVPIPDHVPAGALSGAYDRYRALPVGEWGGIALTDGDIVGLVNVRIISQSLGIPAERVIERTGSAGSYVELYALLKR